MRRFTALAAAALLLSGVTLRAADPPGEQVIDLKLIQVERPYQMSGVSLQKGQGETPFPNRLGTLKFALQGKKLFIDSNGDGKIDDNDKSIKPRSEQELVKVQGLLGSREVDYPVFIGPFNGSDDNQPLMIGSGAMLEGQLRDGKIRLGLGGLSAKTEPKPATFQFIPSGQDANSVGQSTWSRTLSLNGRLFQNELMDGGWKLKLTPYTGPVASVKLKLAPTYQCEATFANVDGAQTAPASAEKAGLFVPGVYRLSSSHLYIKKGEGHICISGRTPEKGGKTYEFVEGENVIALGGPFTLDFKAEKSGDNVEFTEAYATGASQEQYGASAGNEKGQLFAAYIRGAGKEQELTKLSYG